MPSVDDGHNCCSSRTPLSSQLNEMPPASVLIVGASRGLGRALTEHYASLGSRVFATIRSSSAGDGWHKGVTVIPDVDCAQEDVGEKIVSGLQGVALDVVVVVAGLMKSEDFDHVSFKDQVEMYKICSIAPVLIVSSLTHSSALNAGAKVVLLTSESGSIGLRTQEEGGGMYGHHGSKAAGNMVGRLLSYDLKERDVIIVMIHPGFLKTEMTKKAGFDKFYDEMGAVTPDEASIPIAKFIDGLTMEQSGKLWAPMGGRGIGNVKDVMGEKAANQTEPLELPW